MRYDSCPGLDNPRMEERLQYRWQHRLLPLSPPVTADGERVVVLSPGIPNNHCGPDFFNAKVMIGDVEWVGNVEIHVKASDWFRHGHHNDRAYDSVILHVVGCDDAVVTRPDGRVIPRIVVPPDPGLDSRLDALTASASKNLPCFEMLTSIERWQLTEWFTALAFERVRIKAERLEQIRAANENDWQTAAYITLARALGFGLNSEPFERLAAATPLRYICRHSDNPETVESILFGQSGLMDSAPADDLYVSRLRSEYRLYSAKYGLRAPVSLGWRHARTRPANKPHRRIAWLAATVAGSDARLVQLMLEAAECDAGRARELFRTALSPYWMTHYTFGQQAETTPPSHMGDAALDRILINAVAPLAWAYGVHRHDSRLIGRATELIEQLAPEQCADTVLFSRCGYAASDALISQGMIQLRRSYCEQSKCIYCRIGRRALACRTTGGSVKSFCGLD